MNDEDARALAALQVDGSLSELVRLRGVATCPHCHRGFGRASLPIHVRRCRSLLPPTVEEEAAAMEQSQPVEPMGRKEARSLVDLCLRFVTRHFESVCMDRIVAFPEAEAALIASMPANLVHRMVVNLVKESKQVKTKNRESRATIETMESALQGARRDVAQLESARDWAATSRARMAEQQQISERLRRELDATKTELASAEAENQQLRAMTESADKKLLRLEAKINTLNAEKATLKKTSMEAQRREMEVTRQLDLVKKVSATNSANSRRKSTRSGSFHERAQHPEPQSTGGMSSRASLKSPSTSNSFTTQRCSPTYHVRPRARGSKIPYPPSIRRMQCEHQKQDEEVRN
ncbi:hypothetical protein PHYPSEUDO_015218 [Phytophthora pseudosyringae]|uniref:Uncharacterized protein n=1 Tax=Phytophthora pseudosyringae TaxID=221518 RepID=A0A8T1W3R7_9STRA|nr:hypothetical protein PHYPSEUDO_015218 [Phytophthora pseudosyringae]